MELSLKKILNTTLLSIFVLMSMVMNTAALAEPREPFFEPINETAAPVKPSRQENTLGIWTGAGQPFPALAGVGLGFNIEGIARASFGYGYSYENWNILQADAKYFLSVDPLSFFVGGGIDLLSGDKTTELLGWSLQFDSGFVPYIGGGIDYQSVNGWLVSVSASVMVPNGRIILFPGIQIGRFF